MKQHALKVLIGLTLQMPNVEGLGRLWGDLKPTSFEKGDALDIHVGQLWSSVVGLVPYDFYSLKFCDSVAGHVYDSDKLKDKQFVERNGIVNDQGVNDRLHESPYQYTVGKDVDGEITCRRVLSTSEKRQFREMIAERYRYQLFIDDLPNATMEKNEDGELEASYKEGLYIGKKYEDGSYIIYNHLDITVKTHEVASGDELRIVGFEV